MRKLWPLLLVAVACSDVPSEQTIIQPPNRITLDKLSGDGQTDTVMHTLTTPLVVQVNDVAANPSLMGPKPGVLVNFVPLDGMVFAGSALTDSLGRAADVWTLGFRAGVQRLEVRAVEANGNPIVYDTFFATAVPSEPHSISLTAPLSGDTILLTAKDTLTITWNYIDGYANAGSSCTRTEPVPSAMDAALQNGWQPGDKLESLTIPQRMLIAVDGHQTDNFAWGTTKLVTDPTLGAANVTVWLVSVCIPHNGQGQPVGGFFHVQAR